MDRAAIYARVSTRDQKTIPDQIADIRKVYNKLMSRLDEKTKGKFGKSTASMDEI